MTTDPTSLGSAGEELARVFHERYEQLAPSFGYETRRESAVPWDEVPEQNRKLMVAVCELLVATLDELQCVIADALEYCDNCDRHGGMPSTATLRRHLGALDD